MNYSQELALAFKRRFTSLQMRGLKVERVIQRHDALRGCAAGPPLGSIPVGSVVTVTVQVRNNTDISLYIFVYIYIYIISISRHNISMCACVCRRWARYRWGLS